MIGYLVAFLLGLALGYSLARYVSAHEQLVAFQRALADEARAMQNDELARWKGRGGKLRAVPRVESGPYRRGA